MAKAKKPVPQGFRTVTANLCVEDASEAIAWYQKAFGAEEISRMTGPDGLIWHAELRIGDTVVCLNDPMMGSRGVRSYGGSPTSLMIFVGDCDGLFARAVGAGAKGNMPPADMFWGDRYGSLRDPYGYDWSIGTHKEDLTMEELDSRFREFLKNTPR
jgi:PhnB protein